MRYVRPLSGHSAKDRKCVTFVRYKQTLIQYMYRKKRKHVTPVTFARRIKGRASYERAKQSFSHKSGAPLRSLLMLVCIVSLPEQTVWYI